MTDRGSAKDLKSSTGVDLNDPVGKYLPPKSPAHGPGQPQGGQAGQAGPSQSQQYQTPVGYSQALPHQYTVPHGHAPYGHQAPTPFVPAPSVSPQPTGSPSIVSPQPVQAAGPYAQSGAQPLASPAQTTQSDVPYKPRPGKWVQKLTAHNSYLAEQGGVSPHATGGGLAAGLQATPSITPPPHHPSQAGPAALAQQFSQVQISTDPLPPPPQHPSRPNLVSPIQAAATGPPSAPSATPSIAGVHNIYAPPLQQQEQQPQHTGLIPPPLPPNRPASASPVLGHQASPMLGHQSPPVNQEPAESYFTPQAGTPEPQWGQPVQSQSPPQQWAAQPAQPQSPPVRHEYPVQQQSAPQQWAQPTQHQSPPVLSAAQQWTQPAQPQSPPVQHDQQQLQQHTPPVAQQPQMQPQPVPASLQPAVSIPPHEATPPNELDNVPSEAPPPYALEAAPGTSAPDTTHFSPPSEPVPAPQSITQQQPQSVHSQPVQQQSTGQQWPNEKWVYRQKEAAAANAGGSTSGAGPSSAAGPSNIPSAQAIQSPTGTLQPPEGYGASQAHSPPTATGDAEYDATMARVYALEAAQHAENMRLQRQNEQHQQQ